MDEDVLDTLGSPLVRVDAPTETTVAAKVESRNPGGSAKDRPALYMVEAAEEAGDLTPGDGIVEPTSGNTGIGLAMVGAVKGYDVTLVMPEGKSIERRRLMHAYGADVELVDGDISEAKDRADALERDAGMVQLRQFENPANPQAHYETTGPEILDQVDDRTVDAFVAGVGTGGTLYRNRAPAPRGVPRRADRRGRAERQRRPLRRRARNRRFPGDGTGVRLAEPRHGPARPRPYRRHRGRRGRVPPARARGRTARRPVLRCLQPRGQNAAAELRESDTFVGDEPLVVTVFWDSGERYLTAGTFDE